MHYLKCNNCGYFNELKSEYLTFCGKCNQKLNNRYKIWKEENPGKNFDEFKNSMGHTEGQVEKLVDDQSTRRPRYFLNIILGFIAGSFLLIGIAYLVRDFEIGTLLPDRKNTTIIEDNWNRKVIGSMGLSLETPFELKPTKVFFPPGSEDYIEEMETHAYQQGTTIIVMANSIRYISSIKPNLQSAAEGSINNLKSLQGIKNLTFSQNNISRSGIEGFLQSGEFVSSQKMKFMNAGFIHDNTLYQVLVQYIDQGVNPTKIARRIIDSIKIEKKQKAKV